MTVAKICNEETFWRLESVGSYRTDKTGSPQRIVDRKYHNLLCSIMS